MGFLRDAHAPGFLVSGCFPQKVLPKNVCTLILLPQEFCIPNPRESNNHFVTPKTEVQPISHTPTTTKLLAVSHSDTSVQKLLALCLSHLSSTTWKKTNNSKSYIALCHTSESKGVSSQGQIWYK